jgi:hypothetical protein
MKTPGYFETLEALYPTSQPDIPEIQSSVLAELWNTGNKGTSICPFILRGIIKLRLVLLGLFKHELNCLWYRTEHRCLGKIKKEEEKFYML